MRYLNQVLERLKREHDGEYPVYQAFDNAERDQRAVNEGNSDRQRDQRHHPVHAVAQLVVSTVEERPAAVEVHDRAEQRRDAGRSRELWGRVAESVLDHPTPQHSGDRQHQREPELVAEHRNAVTGMLVVPGVGVAMCSLPGTGSVVVMRLMIVLMMVVVMHVDTSYTGCIAG